MCGACHSCGARVHARSCHTTVGIHPEAKMGTPKFDIGMGRKIPGEIQRVCRISTDTPGPGNSRKFNLWTPFW